MHGTVGGPSAACAPSFFFFLKKAFWTAVGAQTIIPYVGVGSYVRRCCSERENKTSKSKIIIQHYLIRVAHSLSQKKFFSEVSWVFYEHKQVYYVSVWAEFTGTCELDKLISIFTSLKNYYQLYLMFCAESTKIVVLGIATRRWRCRTSHRPKIMSDLDLTSHIDTEKMYNICFTNICTLFRDGCVEALISVGTTRTLSSERTRVPCGCATTNMRNIVAQRLRMFYCNEHIVKLFFLW